MKYFNATIVSQDKSHYLNIYVTNSDGKTWALVSKSNDGFFFESPCDESNELVIDSGKNIDKVSQYVKEYFLNKGYRLSTF